MAEVDRWDVVTIGNPPCNPYWGEGDEGRVRSVICSCTLVSGDGFRLLVDPSIADADAMAAELDRRTGLKPGQIDAVFITHRHRDHFAGLGCFPDADWLAAPGVAEAINEAADLPREVRASGGRLMDAIDVVPTPGHTATHHALRFDCWGSSVVLAGDAAMTRDYFADRRGFRNAVDFEKSARTLDQMAKMADVVVPGHGSWFLVEWVS